VQQFVLSGVFNPAHPVGTIAQPSRQTPEERMSAKAQEVALDRLLVERFKGGDAAAFDEMVTRYWDRIYAIVHQLLRNQQDAEEVTQDAFIRAHRGLVNFRGDSAFSTWLYQIATNLARNRYWYWWRRKRDKTLSFDQPVGDENDTTLAEIIPSEAETPGDLTVTQELVDRIAEGMEKLGRKHREILILRNVKNLSYEEIATILAISVGTVKSRIARAREALRENIGEDFK
jgi:RNA polymerase sigma-70 factor, ECF subfamily